MSRKLSNKLLREIVSAGPIDFDSIVEALDKGQTSYNEHMLRGFLEDATGKGWLKEVDGKYQIHRKTSGGGTPTTLYRIDKPLTPEKAKMVEKPYSKELEADAEAGWARTPLAAIRKAKTAFYKGVSWPGIERYRQMEEEVSTEAEAA